MTEDEINRFGGVGRLYGKDNLERFLRSHVMIIGLGGVGSWTVESLARSGVGKLTLVDLDELCITNTNRQLPAHGGNYGKMKANALAERVKLINPSSNVTVEHCFYSEKNSEILLSSTPDIVIDAIDSVKAKSHLLAKCIQQNLPIISCGGAGGKMDATKIKIADLSQTTGDKLSSSVRTTLRKEYGFPSGAGKRPKKFKIPTVYSDEPMTAPHPCTFGEQPEITEAPKNLNCATGYGAITHVTATFGLIITQLTLEALSNSPSIE